MIIRWVFLPFERSKVLKRLRGASNPGVSEASMVLLAPQHGILAEMLALTPLMLGVDGIPVAGGVPVADGVRVADGIPVANGTREALHQHWIEFRNPCNQRTRLAPNPATPPPTSTNGVKLVPFSLQVGIQKAARMDGEAMQTRPRGLDGEVMRTADGEGQVGERTRT